MSHEKLIIDEEEIVEPHDFEFQLTHYMIAPERREGNCLVEVMRLSSGKLVKVNVTSKGTVHHPCLELTASSSDSLATVELYEVKKRVAWRLRLHEDLKPFYELVKDDLVMQATIAMHYGAKDKRNFTMFDALVNAICAQNIRFNRLYAMMSNLTQAFGDAVQIDDAIYYAFPTPEQIAAASLEAMRSCGVGYRGRFLRAVASAVVEGKANLELIKNLPLEDARSQLMQLPGVGPYTADLAIALGAGRLDILHLDLFVREALWTFYFHGRHAPDRELREFAAQCWGRYQAYAALYLTTNTDLWARAMGEEFRLKSGARRLE